MSDSAETKRLAEGKGDGAITRFLRATEIDSRILGMIAALVVIWVGFDIYSGILRPSDGLFGGTFLTPRNLWTLLVQTSSIAVMATGMVLIIVMRHIDLSVGSILAFVAVVIGSLQVFWLPALGLPIGHPMIWPIAVLVALLLGGTIGAFHGLLIAYAGIPAFIVTLGGLIFWRGASWAVIRGETVAPMDATFKLIGGGISGTTPGSIGFTASWVLAVIACAGVVMGIVYGRSQRRRFNFPLRPMWAEAFLAITGCVVLLGATAVINRYYWPKGVVNRWAKQENITIPDGGFDISFGYAIPVLIALGVAIVMTFLSTRTKFGRYIYAAGGNPEAAELAGINTKLLTVATFAVMGMLAGMSACISTGRLNAASNALGLFDELYVIAAAVIGGTSLSGGLGTIYGAVLGALVMQSLQSGMTLLNFESAYKDMVVGGVLVFAVWVDQVYRRRIK
ncbi:sugar ABC transporter permease [Primorskyibacter sp. 2E233]|uniref:sugar ABC transporter permease n=1 Tax=Primorskyibacter sp. 2E233 TaxID=3413431 RepID=UPI003BF22C2F